LLALALLALVCWNVARAQARELRVVFIAYENPDQLLEDVRPVVAYLEGKLGRKVRPFVATDYAGVVEALKNETADVGFMGPLQYLLAHEQAGAQAILGEVYNGQPWYVARIFVRKDSGIRTLADLRGKTIAFVDPLSSSGYLYPLEAFRRAGLIAKREEAEQFFRKIYFAGGDEQALRAVLNKFVDAAGIGQYSFAMLRPEERDEVTFIGESPRIPSHCVVARKGLDAASVGAIQDALLALNEGSNRGLLKQLYNVDGYVKVTHQTFAETEKIAREYGFLKDKRR
jgi:phosphonate transport system substrate-binding protein